MHIHISINYVPRQIGWSACYCENCQQIEAARYDEILEVVEVFFVPVTRTFNCHGGRCDFCEWPVTQWVIKKSIPIEGWSPQEGLGLLYAKLEMPPDVQVGSVNADARLHSLLRSIEAKCAFNGMDVRLGLLIGGILGAGGCAAICAILGQQGFRIGQLDLLGSIFASILAGGLVGVILGGTLQVLLTRNRVMKRRLKEAYCNYGIDLKRLQEIALTHSPIIRRAVRRLRDFESMSR